MYQWHDSNNYFKLCMNQQFVLHTLTTSLDFMA